jgi:CRP-like cAMP-binding protein
MSLSNCPNHFLSHLSPEDSASISPHLKSAKLQSRDVLHYAEETIRQVYFPFTGVVSLVVRLSDGMGVEAGLFGRNSVIGGGAALDGSIALNEAIGQVRGEGVTAEPEILKKLVSQSPTLRKAFASHEQVAMAQVQQTAACNATHQLEERLCRWLLQVRDLLQDDVLPLTQEFLSQMLGVQRTSVTLVANRLQAVGFIKYNRGRITTLDADGLRESCCECYDAINAHLERRVGWTPTGVASAKAV